MQVAVCHAGSSVSSEMQAAEQQPKQSASHSTCCCCSSNVSSQINGVDKLNPLNAAPLVIQMIGVVLPQLLI